jgi:hypothetical protein
VCACVYPARTHTATVGHEPRAAPWGDPWRDRGICVRALPRKRELARTHTRTHARACARTGTRTRTSCIHRTKQAGIATRAYNRLQVCKTLHTLRCIRIISYHIIRRIRIISYHIIRRIRIISYHIIRRIRIISYHIIRRIRIISYHIIRCIRIISYHIIRCIRIISYHIISYRIMYATQQAGSATRARISTRTRPACIYISKYVKSHMLASVQDLHTFMYVRLTYLHICNCEYVRLHTPYIFASM